MVEIGRINKLILKRRLDFGMLLEGGDAGDVLLAKKDIPEDGQIGDAIEVFVYADKEGRLLATTHMPVATVGQFAGLRVVAQTPAGAYLDWGMQKDLLVPKREQTETMEVGKVYIVYVLLNEKNKRLFASAKLDKYISELPPDYDVGEDVDLVICAQTDLGYKAIINNAHWGVLYKNEVFQKLHIGQQLPGYIKKVRDDFKVDLSLQQAGYKNVDKVCQSILDKIKDMGGGIALTDKSPPEDIYSLFGMSKKTFKKAVGGLYKRRLIRISPEGIKIVRR